MTEGIDSSPVMVGRLLVASPKLVDSNFDRSVVLLLEHRPEGALGVIINQPTISRVRDVLSTRWEAHVILAPPPLVFAGGPVSPGAAIGLGRCSDLDVMKMLDGASSFGEKVWVSYLFNDICVVDLSASPEDLGTQLDGVRIYFGYAGWGPGQLEDEIESGAWMAVESVTDDVFTARPEHLWHDVLFRQGGDLAMMANYPIHPRLN
ncbi:MAG: YqgE/AlgH family protein [Acidimicrobiales bacterium]